MSCSLNESTSVIQETDMPTFRYLALGDSYTIGESVPAKDRWPNQLARILGSDGLQAEVTIVARTGWTVDELWQGIQEYPPTGTYDLVTLLIGVNDQYRGYPIDGYREDFHFMLNKAIEYAGGNPDKVVVLSIPDCRRSLASIWEDVCYVGRADSPCCKRDSQVSLVLGDLGILCKLDS